MSHRQAAVAVAVGVAAVAVGLVSVRRAMDFPIYYDAAIRAMHGDRSLYELDALSSGIHYRYAPVFALLVAPFTLVPLPIATFAWYGLKLVAIAISVHVGMRLTASDAGAPRVCLAAFLLAGAYLVEEAMTGNAHFLAISCLVTALYLVERGRVAAPSALIAIAVLAKVTPALALPYLAIRRRWRVFAGTLVALVALCLAPSLLVGRATNAVWLGDWARTVFDRVDARPNEQDDSLKGALFRFFPTGDAPPGHAPFVVAPLSRSVVMGAWATACALVLAAFFRVAAGPRTPPAHRAFEHALLVVSLLLVSPHNTRIYYSALFFPYVVLVIAALDQPDGSFRRRLRRALWVSLVLNTVVPAIVPGRSASLAYEALSPFVWTSVVAFVALLALTRRPALSHPTAMLETASQYDPS